MDAAAGPAQFLGRRVRRVLLHPLHELEPLVQRVGGDVGGDLVGLRGRERGVGTVHGDLVCHAPGPEAGVGDPGPRPHRGVGPGLAQRLYDPLAGLRQPLVQDRRVAPLLGSRGEGDLLLRDVLLSPVADQGVHPAQGAAHMTHEVLQRPVRAGRYGGGQVRAGRHHCPQLPHLVGDFIAVPVMCEQSHAPHPRGTVINRARRFPSRRTRRPRRPRSPARPGAHRPPPGAGHRPGASDGRPHGCP